MSKIPNEIQIQEKVSEFLQEHEIFPFRVTFTYSDDSGGLLGITFYLPTEINEFLELFDYKTTCDKSGYEVFTDTNTVILKDLALVQLYTVLK